jgi:hypothetical protein
MGDRLSDIERDAQTATNFAAIRRAIAYAHRMGGEAAAREAEAAVTRLHDKHRGAVEALDTLADAVRDTLCDEESCGRCRMLRDALPAKTSGFVPEHPGARGASLTGVTVPPNAARPSPTGTPGRLCAARGPPPLTRLRDGPARRQVRPLD